MVKKSPFPQDFLGVDLYYDSQWNPVGTDLDQSGIRVHHGASSEGGEADVSSLEFALTNSAGKYNPRNPSSPLAGKIGRNTPARSTVKLGAPFLSLPISADTPGAWAPDSASISTTGDVDVRWWGSGPFGAVASNLITKWSSSGNQRSWAFTVSAGGGLNFWHSTTGADQFIATSTAPIPSWAGPIALRATIRVNNGAGGRTVTFYYAKDLDSPWTQLGAPIVTAGVVSLFDGTASLFLATSMDDVKVFGYELRHGIDAFPASAFRFDRGVPGYNRTPLVGGRRTNLFHDGRAKGTYALGQSGATFQRLNGEFVLTKTGASGVTAYGALRGVAPTMLVSTVHTVRFDYRFSGGVQVFYRPQDSITGTTGQVNLTSSLGLIQDGQWHTTSATFTTTATAPGSNSAGLVLQTLSTTLPGVEARVRNVIVRTGTRTTEDMGEVFDGWDTNTPERFYYWTAVPYASPAIEYQGEANNLRFADDSARIWVLQNTGRVVNQHTTATCEVAEWPVDWNTRGAPSVMTAVTANGVSRRMGQGAQGVEPALFRAIMNRNNPYLRAYWPLEEAKGAKGWSAAYRGNRIGWSGGPPDLESYTGFGGSKPLPVIRTTQFQAGVPGYANTGAIQVRFLMHQPSGGSASHTICTVYLTGAGSITQVSLIYTSGAMRLLGTDSDGVSKFDTGPVAFNTNGKDLRAGIELSQVGSAVSYKMLTLDAAGSGLAWSGTAASNSIGRVTGILFNPDKVDLDVAIGHITMEAAISTIYDIPQAIIAGYPDEPALSRIKRLSSETGIVTQVTGNASIPRPMGPQAIDTLLNLLADSARADGGLLHDDPEDIQLRFRALDSMMSQPPIVIPYQDNLVIPFAVSDDDALTRNRVTVQNPVGEFGVSEVTTGPLSTAPAPTGVGLYDATQDVNLSGSGDTLQRAADWATHVGTWDDARYPTLGVDLAHPYFLANPVLTRQLLAMVPGDRLVIQNPPPWLPPRAVDVLVMGINHDITPLHARLTFVCVPARPYKAGYLNHTEHRFSGEGTTITGALNSTATSFALTLPFAVVWTSADGPYDIEVNGEVMTVTNVTGSTMTVTRSVNGVVKSHPAGSSVSLASPSFYAR